jgi:hypothetical protein
MPFGEHDLTSEPSVARATGAADLGFDDQVHIDLDRAHTVVSPDEARRFAAELKRIADAIDPLSCRRRGSARIGQRDGKTFDMRMACHRKEEVAEAYGCGQDVAVSRLSKNSALAPPSNCMAISGAKGGFPGRACRW